MRSFFNRVERQFAKCVTVIYQKADARVGVLAISAMSQESSKMCFQLFSKAQK